MSQSVSVQAIAEDVYAAPQLSPEAMASAAEAGFKAVINNRPDMEGGPDQPGHSMMRALHGSSFSSLSRPRRVTPST